MSDNIKHLCYKKDYGFAVYNPDDGSIRHTQDIREASEPLRGEWSDVLGFELVDYQFTPANISIDQLTAENARLRAALIEIRDRCQITGLTFECQSFLNTDCATAALIAASKREEDK